MEFINILYSFLIIISGVFIIKLLEKHINKLKDSSFFKELIKHSKYSEVLFWYFSYFIKLGLYIIIGLIAISVLGFAPQILGLLALIMALAIIGVIAYSTREVIPSMIAGAYLLNSKIIKKGDKIRFENIKGIVTNINLINLTLKDTKGTIILIPNKLIMKKIFKKY